MYVCDCYCSVLYLSQLACINHDAQAFGKHAMPQAVQHMEMHEVGHGILLFARMVKLSQAPVYKPQLLLLMIYHHLHKHCKLCNMPTGPV